MNKIKSALLSTAVLSMAFLTNSAMADQQSDALVTKTPFDVSSKTFEVTAQHLLMEKQLKALMSLFGQKKMVKMISNGIQVQMFQMAKLKFNLI